MLAHLPIVILTSLHPLAVADTVPKLDIARECQFEGGTKPAQERCATDEKQAREPGAPGVPHGSTGVPQMQGQTRATAFRQAIAVLRRRLPVMLACVVIVPVVASDDAYFGLPEVGSARFSSLMPFASASRTRLAATRSFTAPKGLYHSSLA